MGEDRKVYIVEVMENQGSTLVAAFSDPADAAAYATMQTERCKALEPDPHVVFRTVAVVPLDTPREEW